MTETASDILKELKNLGDAATKKMQINNGAKEPVFGVKAADLKKIVKRVKKNHALALDLFATGNSDAMYLAALIADENEISKSQLETWVNAAYWPWLCEFSVPWVAGESPFGFELAMEWIESDLETVASSGWGILAYLPAIKPDADLDLAVFEALLKRVESHVHDDKNRVSHMMNAFVIAVGHYILPLSEQAAATAKIIGKVEVDMGTTACKVPLASLAIEKVAKRGATGKKRKSARA